MGDSGDDAVEKVMGSGVARATEAKRIEDGDRPSAHRKDVADDSPHAGRRALKRLDRAGMIVALDFHHNGKPIADVDDARVLAGTLDDAFPGRREVTEE